MFRFVVLAVLALAVRPEALARQAEPTRSDVIVQRSMDMGGAPLLPEWIVMDVCGSGAVGRRGFLNSVADYRNRRSLNVELVPTVRLALHHAYNADPVEHLLGYRILVYGSARQVRINLLSQGEPVGKFYFQTQLRLAAPDHIRLMTENGEPVLAQCEEPVA